MHERNWGIFVSFCKSHIKFEGFWVSCLRGCLILVFLEHCMQFFIFCSIYCKIFAQCLSSFIQGLKVKFLKTWFIFYKLFFQNDFDGRFLTISRSLESSTVRELCHTTHFVYILHTKWLCQGMLHKNCCDSLIMTLIECYATKVFFETLSFLNCLFLTLFSYCNPLLTKYWPVDLPWRCLQYNTIVLQLLNIFLSTRNLPYWTN